MRGLERHLVAGAFNSSLLHPVGLSNESKDHDPFPAAPWTIAADSKRQHPQPLTDTTHTLTLILFIRSGALCCRFCRRNAGHGEGYKQYVNPSRCSEWAGFAKPGRQMYRVCVARASSASGQTPQCTKVLHFCTRRAGKHNNPPPFPANS